jgi:hypothetical protein
VWDSSGSLLDEQNLTVSYDEADSTVRVWYSTHLIKSKCCAGTCQTEPVTNQRTGVWDSSASLLDKQIYEHSVDKSLLFSGRK